MASRAELVRMCKEFDIDNEELTMADMDQAIKDKADYLFRSKKIKHSANILSKTLRKFLTNEYHYVIMNVSGNELDENLEEK